MHGELVVDFLSILFSNEVSLLLFYLWYLNLEFLNYPAGNWVIDAV